MESLVFQTLTCARGACERACVRARVRARGVYACACECVLERARGLTVHI